MTEDSDLIIFGTGKLLVKLDDNSGALVEIDATNLKKVESLESFMPEGDRVKWLRFACIMQGTIFRLEFFDFLDILNSSSQNFFLDQKFFRV